MTGHRAGRFALTAVSVAVAAPGALAAGHLTTLTVASLLPSRRQRTRRSFAAAAGGRRRRAMRRR